MSDQRLRELERRRGASVDDEAAWLAERLRTGSLTRERLDLAAWCGHEAAIRAGGTAGATEAAAWIKGVEPLSPTLALWALAEGSRGRDENPSPDRLERIRAGAREAFLDDDLPAWASRELADPAHVRFAGEKRVLLALHHLVRDPRQGDPDDPDVLRALESVRPRFPYLDPGAWSYAWSERRRGTWAHHLRYTRLKGGESQHLVDAAPSWAPPAGAKWAGPRVLEALIFDEDWPGAPAHLLETAIDWALR